MRTTQILAADAGMALDILGLDRRGGEAERLPRAFQKCSASHSGALLMGNPFVGALTRVFDALWSGPNGLNCVESKG
jgi:hypothetical protein